MKSEWILVSYYMSSYGSQVVCVKVPLVSSVTTKYKKKSIVLYKLFTIKEYFLMANVIAAYVISIHFWFS